MATPETDQRAEPSLILAAGALLVCTGLFTWASGRGFDLTDEANSLLLIARPADFPVVTDFAAWLRPLYDLFGGSIAALRLAGLVILTGSALVFGRALARFKGLSMGRAALAIMLTIALAALWRYARWLPTPNYNLLNLAGLMLVFAGLLDGGGEAQGWRGRLISAALTAFGVVLTATNKPTTTLAAALVAGVWLLTVRRPRLGYLALVTGLSALFWLAAATAFGGDPLHYVEDKLAALNDLRALSGGDLHGLGASAAGGLAQGGKGKLLEIAPYAAGLGLAALAWAAAASDGRRVWTAWAAGSVAVLIAVLAGVWRWIDMADPAASRGPYVWYVVFPACLAALAAVVIWRRKASVDRPARKRLAAAALLACGALAYSFGTNVPLILHTFGAAPFWAAAMVVVASLSPAPEVTLRQTLALVAAVTLGMAASLALAPDREGLGLAEQTIPLTLGPDGGRLAVDETMAAYLGPTMAAARAAGFTAGTPVLDLSAAGPGLTFALGGRPVGAAWIEGADHGLARVAQGALRRAPDAQLRAAWIITRPDASFTEAAAVLHQRGLDFPATYRQVAQTPPRQGKPGQTLWRPN
ncbi:hypothetical protein BH11PSE2_BH11PSE2_00950 [soil metagenome]